jgi:hypothetical protein
MKASKRRRGWLIGFVLFGLLIALLWTLWPRERSLLDQATSVCALKTWYQAETSNYGWLSDHELLHFLPGETLASFDLQTKTETPLPALARLVKGSSASFDGLNVSPDGRWVLWGERGYNSLFVAATDGFVRFQWPGYGGLSEAYWLTDSHHWLQNVFGGNKSIGQIHLRNVDTPYVSQTFPTVPTSLQGLNILAALSQDRLLIRTPDPSTVVKAFSLPGARSVKEIQTTYRDKQQLSLWNLRSGSLLRQWTIHLPGLASDVHVSPQGDRMAWLLQNNRALPWDTLLHRLFPAWRMVKHFSMSLWVSRLDGSQMHEVGSIVLRSPAVRAGQISWPWNIRWLPGGKRLSFLYNDALWTVPAE